MRYFSDFHNAIEIGNINYEGKNEVQEDKAVLVVFPNTSLIMLQCRHQSHANYHQSRREKVM